MYVNDDHHETHTTLMDEAVRLAALRARVQRVYGPAPATRSLAPVGLHQRAFWADADARRPVAMPPAPSTFRQPLPAMRSAVALDRRWDRLRAALRLRIGEGVMPG